MDRGMLDLFCEEKALCTVRGYWSQQFIAGNKTEEKSNELPTDQEHRPGDRADQTHRVQLIARSISFGCIILGEINFPCCLLSLRKTSFKVLYSCQQYSSSSLCCRQNLLKRPLFVLYKLSHCFNSN